MLSTKIQTNCYSKSSFYNSPSIGKYLLKIKKTLLILELSYCKTFYVLVFLFFSKYSIHLNFKYNFIGTLFDPQLLFDVPAFAFRHFNFRVTNPPVRILLLLPTYYYAQSETTKFTLLPTALKINNISEQ